MIKIENENEGLKKSIFEFFRMKLPKDYKNLNINLKINIDDDFVYIEVDGDKIHKIDKLKIENEKIHFIVKRYLFDLFFKKENFDPSFGILTGVRPLKLISKVFEGYSYDDSLKILYEKYRIGEEDL